MRSGNLYTLNLRDVNDDTEMKEENMGSPERIRMRCPQSSVQTYDSRYHQSAPQPAIFYAGKPQPAPTTINISRKATVGYLTIQRLLIHMFYVNMNLQKLLESHAMM